MGPEDKLRLWAMFFASVVSFQYHPGRREQLTLDECAKVADRMMVLVEDREWLWRG